MAVGAGTAIGVPRYIQPPLLRVPSLPVRGLLRPAVGGARNDGWERFHFKGTLEVSSSFGGNTTPVQNAMAELFKSKLRRSELFIIWVLAGMLILEFLLLIMLVYFSTFPVFLALFVRSLRVLSPIFLALNIVFLIITMLVRGKELIAQSWATYLSETLRLSILSFVFAAVLLVLSAMAGVALEFLLSKLYHALSIHEIMTYLRQWIRDNLY